jgi:hypothetical protein
MTSPRTNVYVDGFNLYYGALKGRGPGYKWLDLARLVQRLFPDHDVCRLRYFTARVSARPNDLQLPDRQQADLRALATLPGLTVHPGEFKVTYPWMPLYQPSARAGSPLTKAQVIKTEEKGSDVNLATYLVFDGCRQDYDEAIVITNDSDLREPVRLVREELQLPVGVINPHSRARQSLAIKASFSRQLRPETVAACQFPDIVKDAAGRSIRKPVGW